MKVAWVLVAVLLAGCRSHRSASGRTSGSPDAAIGGEPGSTGGAVGRGGAGGAVAGTGGAIEAPDAAPIDLAPDRAPDLIVPPDLVARDAPPNDPIPRDVALDLPADTAPLPPDAADAGPDAPPPPTPEFHLTLPLSSSVVTTHSPTVGWTDPGGTDYFIIDICRDVGCSDIVERNFSGLTTYTVTATLPDGVTYWRVKAMLPMNAGQLTTATAELFVGGQTPHDTSMLAFPDFNRDGVADLALAAEGGDVTVRYLKAAPGGPTASTPQVLPGPARALAYGVDLNSDGFGDLLVSRPTGIDVYYGTATTLIQVQTLTGAPGFGATLAGVGDVNGDGFGDVVIGSGAGTASLFLSSRQGLSKPTGQALPSPRFGPAADIDADGYADVVACSPVSGTLYLYRGSAGGLVAAGTLEDPRGPGAGTFGSACRGVGDVNGDGFADVVVTGSGAQLLAFVYFGGEKGLGAPATLMLGSTAGHTADDLDVAFAGDVNHDGYADVAITGAGALRLFLGGASGPGSTPATTISADLRLAGGLADLDGDHNGDVVVAPRGCADQVKIYAGRGAGLDPAPIYTVPAGGTAVCPAPLLAR